MENNNWDQYKKIYNSISVSQETVDMQWENLSARLPQQERNHIPHYAKFGFAFLGITLLLTAGLIGASQNAQPGETLYLVKELTENVRSTVLKGPNQSTQVPSKSVIKKPTATPTPTKVPPPTPTIKNEVKGTRTELKIEKLREKKVIPQTGQAIRQNENNNAAKNENKPEDKGNNSQNGQDKPKNENAEQKGNSENKSQRNK